MSSPLPLDVRHLQTPTDQRGAGWWMAEHRIAEQAVTSAAGMIDHATSKEMAYYGRRHLDTRLDHLERVEDICDEILAELRRTAPPWVADVCERHYIKGETWASIGSRHGMSGNYARGKVLRELSRVEVASA